MSTGVARKAFDAGFGPYMVQVAPPGAAGVTDAGKIPAGHRPASGTWYPLSVHKHKCTSKTMADEWDAVKSNVGFGCGRDWNLAGADLDINDVMVRDVPLDVFRRHVPDLFIRGVKDPNHNRVLVPFRIDGALRGTKLLFETPQGSRFKIEVLGPGAQFVAYGIHPGTRTPYDWTPLDPTDVGAPAFPLISLNVFKAILQETEEEFAKLGIVRVSGAALGVRPPGGAGQMDATEEEVRALLALVPNDLQFADYDDWVRMCLALIGASDGQPWGREAWIEWSNQQAQPRSPTYPEQKWDENAGAKAQVLGVWWLRKEARRRHPAKTAAVDFRHNLDDAEIAQTAATIAGPRLIMPRLQAQWCYVASEDKFLDFRSGQLFGKGGFDGLNGPLVPDIRKEMGFSGKKGPKSASALFLQAPNTSMVKGITYHPGEGRFVDIEPGVTYANTWKAGFIPQAAYFGVQDLDIMDWIDHIQRVLKDPLLVPFFIKWCAFVVQYPNRKPNWGWVISTLVGLGKDMMVIPLIHAVGKRNHKPITPDTLEGQFTDYLQGRLMVVSETRQTSRRKAASDVFNDLKQYLATPPDHVFINEKNMRRFKAPNLSAWIFFSNHINPIYLEQHDRRLLVVENFNTPLPPPSHYVALKAYLENEKDRIATFLMEYPLTQDDIALIEGQAPVTQAKVALIHQNRPPLEADVLDVIEDARMGAGTGLVATQKDITFQLRNIGGYASISGSKLAEALWNCGARPVKIDPTRGGRTAAPIRTPKGSQRLWLLAKDDAKGRDYTKLTEKELKDVYVTGSVPLDSDGVETKVVNLRPSKSAPHEEDEV